MSKIEPIINELYLKSIHIGLAPTECSDVSKCFQIVMLVSNNIVLPFSEKGLKIWDKKNRHYLANQAIKKYQKELLRLEFELEKIH